MQFTSEKSSKKIPKGDLSQRSKKDLRYLPKYTKTHNIHLHRDLSKSIISRVLHLVETTVLLNNKEKNKKRSKYSA